MVAGCRRECPFGKQYTTPKKQKGSMNTSPYKSQLQSQLKGIVQPKLNTIYTHTTIRRWGRLQGPIPRRKGRGAQRVHNRTREPENSEATKPHCKGKIRLQKGTRDLGVEV
jgi:hypothetical protein